MSGVLFLADVWMKTRPARGGRASHTGPATDTRRNKGRISQIASSHIPSLNSAKEE